MADNKGRTQKILIIEDGKLKFENEMKMLDVLKYVHKEMRDDGGDSAEGQAGALKYRDLRQVLSDKVDNQPSVEVRRNCILVSLPPVRCIVLHNKVMVFDPIDDLLAATLYSHLKREHERLQKQKKSNFLKGFSLAKSSKAAADKKNDLEAMLTDALPKLQEEVTRHVDEDDEAVVPVDTKGKKGDHGKKHNNGPQEPESEIDRLIPPTNPFRPVAPLIEKLLALSRNKEAMTTTFELGALEAVFVEVCQSLNALLEPIKNVVEVSSKQLYKEGFAAANSFEFLHWLRSRLKALKTRVENIHAPLAKLLSEDDQMHRLDLSAHGQERADAHRKIKQIGSQAMASLARAATLGGGARRGSDASQVSQTLAAVKLSGEDEKALETLAQQQQSKHNSEEAELLLQCYVQEVEYMINTMTHLDETMDDVMQLMNLQLAAVRNKIMKLDFGLTIVMAVVGFVGAVAGIFGMNMRNTLEDSLEAFLGVAIGCLGLCVLSVVVVCLLFTFRPNILGSE